MVLRKTSLSKKIKNFIKKIDSYFYFPIFLLIVLPFIFYFNGIKITYLFFVCATIFHAILCLFVPYYNDSGYLHYKKLSQEFFEQKVKYKLPFPKYLILFAYIFLFFSIVYTFSKPTLSVYLFPFQLGFSFIIGIYSSVEVLNVLNRPILPSHIKIFHPIMQKRYNPFLEILFSKVGPAVGICVGCTGVFYGTWYSGCKWYHGDQYVEPIREFVLNKGHGFPEDHVWTEKTLSDWSEFKRSKHFHYLLNEKKLSPYQITQAFVEWCSLSSDEQFKDVKGDKFSKIGSNIEPMTFSCSTPSNFEKPSSLETPLTRYAKDRLASSKID